MFLQAFNKVKGSEWRDSHDLCNLRPSTRIPFDIYIERVKEVIEAADYFYIKRNGMFDAMPACWKHLNENESCELVVLIDSFYEESRADPLKAPWSVDMSYLNLSLKLDDIYKFWAAYLSTLGDDSIFKDPVTKSFAASAPANSNLLDTHDTFSLKPKKLVKEYQDNPGGCTTQGKLFVHMTTFVFTEHVTASKNVMKSSEIEEMTLPNGTRITVKASKPSQLEPAHGLHIKTSINQKRLLNPTPQDVMISELIDQAQGEQANKKEAK